LSSSRKEKNVDPPQVSPLTSEEVIEQKSEIVYGTKTYYYVVWLLGKTLPKTLCQVESVTVMPTDEEDISGDIRQRLSHAACPDTDKTKFYNGVTSGKSCVCMLQC